MNILIAYASRYGATEKCVKILSDKLLNESNKIEVLNLRKSLKTDLDKYDIVIIGGSFVISKLNSYVKKFVGIYQEKLMKKKVGIFMCGTEENDWINELSKGYPEQLFENAIAKGYFGYEMNFEAMNPIIRKMMSSAYKTDKSFSRINESNIDKFTDDIKQRI